jgi:FkbM family methyltransferase
MKKLKRLVINFFAKVIPYDFSIIIARFFLVIQGIGFAVEIEDSGEIEAIRKIIKIRKPVIFDVGGNIGNYSSAILKAYPGASLHVFEPSEIHYLKIVNKLSRYKGSIYINPLGLSDKSETMVLNKDREVTGSATLCNGKFDTDFEIKEKVALISGEEYVDKMDINHIDYIKIDVEGWEMPAIRGLGKYLENGFIDCIQFEITNKHLERRESFWDFYNFFTQRKYFVYLIRTNGAIKRIYQEDEIFDNYFPTNYVAIRADFSVL